MKPHKTALFVDVNVNEPILTSLPLDDVTTESLQLRVVACGLNFADLLMIDGTYQDTPPRPFVPGMEVCGIVEGIKDHNAGFAIGDRVVAYVGHGGLATHVNAPISRCRKVPESMDDITAAGFLIAYGTSHLGLLRRARLKNGDRLVVLGASGGVGLTAVEIGKAVGAEVVAVARGSDKLTVAKQAGADHLIDATTEDLNGDLRALGGVDVVYDAVGGTLGVAAMRALKPEGRHLLIGFASGDVPTIKPNHMLVKNTELIGFYWGAYAKFAPDVMADSIEELMTWHAEGRIRPHVSHVLPLDRANDGLDLLRQRKATGKVVITP